MNKKEEDKVGNKSSVIGIHPEEMLIEKQQQRM